MGQLTQWQADQLTEQRLALALAQKLGNIELAVKLARMGMTEIAEIRCLAADKVATTVAVADQLVKAAAYAGRITPEKEEEVRQHTQQYLHEMLGIAHDAGSQIVDVLLQR